MLTRCLNKLKIYLFPDRQLSADELQKYYYQENVKIRDYILLFSITTMIVYPAFAIFYDPNVIEEKSLFHFKIFRVSFFLLAMTSYLYYLRAKDYFSKLYKMVFLIVATLMIFAHSVILSFSENVTTFMPYVAVIICLYLVKIKPLNNIIYCLLLLLMVTTLSFVAGHKLHLIVNNSVVAIFMSIIFSMRNYSSIKQFKINQDLQNKLIKNNKLLTNTYEQLVHDVKSPLTAIKFVAEKNDNSSNLLKQATERVQNIILDLESKNALLNQPINISKIINLTIQEAKIRYNIKNNNKFRFNKNIKLDQCKSNLKNINESQLSRAISNIINNSIEANTSKGCEIDILVSKINSYIFISIQDNGAGIEESELNCILKEGYTTKKSGKGLGLYYLSKIIKDNNGELKISSKSGLDVNMKLQMEKQSDTEV